MMNKDVSELCEKARSKYGESGVVLDYVEASTEWLDAMDQNEGDVLHSMEYDPGTYPYQYPFVPEVEAHAYDPNVSDDEYYARGDAMMGYSLGKEEYHRLLELLRNMEVVKTMMANQRGDENGEKRNIVIVTPHTTYSEVGYVLWLLTRAMENREFIDQCGVILGKNLARMKFVVAGEPLVEVLNEASNVFFTSPVSENSEKYKVPKTAERMINALFLKALMPDLERGGAAIHVALTGGRVVTAKAATDGFDGLKIPDVKKSSADLVDFFDGMIGINVMWSPVTGHWELVVSDLIDIKKSHDDGKSTAEIVDSLYGEFASTIHELTGERVGYSPLAARLGGAAVTRTWPELILP